MIWSLLACATATAPTLTLTSTAVSSAGAEPLNVVWIVVDNLRADSWPSALNGWANTATVWPVAHAAATQSYPGNASMMTGQYVPSHGATGPGAPLADSAHTWAEHLTANGYDTWSVSASPVLTEERGFHQGFATWETLPGDQPDAEDVTAAAIAAWDSMAGPKYLRVHYQDVHAPLGAPGADDTAERSELDSYDDGAEPTPEDLDRIHAAYAAEVEYAADHIIDLIDAVGCDTVIVITSDHGESFGEDGEWGHNDLYRETTEVPLAIYVPGMSGRERTDHPSTIDVVPTLNGILGLSPSDTWHGRDLFCDPRMLPSYTSYGVRSSVVSTDGRWRYVRDGGSYLYDRESDPDETVNVASDNPDVVSELNGFRVDVESR